VAGGVELASGAVGAEGRSKDQETNPAATTSITAPTATARRVGSRRAVRACATWFHHSPPGEKRRRGRCRRHRRLVCEVAFRFVEDPSAYARVAADVIAHMARLISTAYTAAEVASGLGVNDSRVRQRRLARTLWAIDDGGTWVYPVVQFEQVSADGGASKLKQVRGLDQVLPALPPDLHPTSVAGFLLTPSAGLAHRWPTKVCAGLAAQRRGGRSGLGTDRDRRMGF
jgi:hypothetical protein